MPGVLQFTLGLEASKFLDTVGLAGGKILGLAGIGETLRKAFDHAWNQIEKGAALEHLSKRTGESVSNLFMLQKGFKAVGLSTDDVAPALFMMQKALGGVNDLGVDTTSIFAKAGLSLEQLKKAGGASALQQILQKMSTMSQTSATAFAGHIFGRNEAASMVQASRSMKDFNDAMAGARAQAQVFQRVAAAFAYIERAVQKVKAKLDPLFLVIAEKIAPALKSVVDWVNNIDLKPLGDAIGNAFDAFAEAFKEGKVVELLSKGFDAAVEYLGNMLFGLLGSGTFWEGIWDVMVGEFEIRFAVIAKTMLGLGTILKSAIETAFNVIFEWVGKIPKVGEYLGLKDYKADTFGETYARNKAEEGPVQKWLSGMLGEGVDRYKTGAGKMGSAIAEAHANAGGPAQEEFMNLLNGLLGRRRSGARAGAKGGEAGSSQDFNLVTQHGHVESSALEKMGFVLGRGAGLGPAETTARNTTTMKEHLAKLVDIASSGTAAGAILTNAHAT